MLLFIVAALFIVAPLDWEELNCCNEGLDSLRTVRAALLLEDDDEDDELWDIRAAAADDAAKPHDMEAAALVLAADDWDI